MLKRVTIFDLNCTKNIHLTVLNEEKMQLPNIDNLTPRAMKVLVYFLTLHTALLVASNAGGAKMIALPFGLSASATVFSYMVTFVILDATAELFGRKYSRLMINVGLGALVLSVIFFSIAIAAPAAPFWAGQTAYENTLGSAWRILLGGWMSYLVSQYLDVWSYFKLKQSKFGGENLWWRSWASTALAQLLDTIIFMTVAFYGVFPLLPAIAGQYLLKLVLAAVGTPVVYLLVKYGRKYSDSE
jgi:queuosine precursor transporter